jgi:glutaredoxin
MVLVCRYILGVFMKLKLFVSSNCPGCQAAKDALKEEISSGEVEVVDTDREEGKKLADKLKIYVLPAVVVEYDDGTYSKCKMSGEGDDLIIECEDNG